MVEHLFPAFSRLQSVNVLVVGDLMLDIYITGQASRLSPEAPVPILHAKSERFLPGGAGNVMLGLKALGARVYALGRVGEDESGKRLLKLVEGEGIESAAIFPQENYKTPEKRRLLAGNHHLMRIDYEEILPLDSLLEELLLQKYEALLAKVEVVAISDYGKGFLSDLFLQKLIRMAGKFDVPVIVDPKGSDFSKYRGAFLIKPNRKEAYIAANLPEEKPLSCVAKVLFKQTKAQHLLVTLSELGMALYSNENESFFPTFAKQVRDVTGAGDTVLAVLALGVGSGLSLSESCELANSAASVCVEHVGCVPVNLAQLGERLLTSSRSTKLFDEHHLFALKQVLSGRPFVLAGVAPKNLLSVQWIIHLKQVAVDYPKEKLILFVPESTPESYLALFSSLDEVSFVIVGSGSVQELCSEIGPTRVLLLEDDRVIVLDEAISLLSRLALCDKEYLEVFSN